MRLTRSLYLLAVAACVFLGGCKKDDHPSPDHFIKTFTFTAAQNTGLTLDIAGVISADTIKVTMPPGANLTHLVPTITYLGAGLSPASGMAQNFSVPVRYTVTAGDGGSRTYVVVVRNQSTDKTITSFQLRPQDNPGLNATIDGVITGDTIILSYSGSLPVSGLIPYITYSGVRISPNAGEKTDFSQPVVYTVTAEDGSVRSYRVFVTPNKPVYIGSDDGYLYAIDAMTGILRWKFGTGGIIRSCPTIDAGTVYVGSGDGYLYAIDSASGSLKWKHWFIQAVHSSPTVSGGVVYIYCDGNLVALDPATGVEIWRYDTGDPINHVASPTVANGKVYLSTFNGAFTIGAVDAATGTPVWGYSGGIGRSNPAVVDGVVYAGDEPHKLVALDAATGAVKWRYFDGNFGSGTSPTVADGKVFIAAYDGFIYAFDIATGTLQWKFDSNGISVGLCSSPVYANGIIFAGNKNGLNYAINATTGKLAWTYGNTLSSNAEATQATAANGTVIFGTTSGKVVALDAPSGGVKWTFETKGGVYSGACVVGVDGKVWHPGESGDTQ